MSDSHRIQTRGRINYIILTFATLLLFAGASLAFGRPAVAQQSPDAAPKSEIASRGQRDVKEIAYGDWKKLCFKPSGTKTTCRTSITGTFATGQIAIRVDIIQREGDPTARLQVFSPVGMYLQKPVRLVIDQGRPYNVPYIWCLTNACIAAEAADPRMIREMTTARSLRLEFVDSSLLILTTSLPLGQFTSVHKGAPAQTFEQDIDE